MPTYRIYKNEKSGPTPAGVNTTVATGIEGFAAADQRRNELQAEEDRTNPGRSSWVKTLYIVTREPA